MGEIIIIFYKLYGRYIVIGMLKKDDKILLQKILFKLKVDILKLKMELIFKFKFKLIINNYFLVFFKKK